MLKETVYHKAITPYIDFATIEAVNLPKFLVTFGFAKLQQSKID